MHVGDVFNAHAWQIRMTIVCDDHSLACIGHMGNVLIIVEEWGPHADAQAWVVHAQ